MHRQGFDVQLTKDADRGWRATFIHDRKRALAYQRDGHRVGANSVNYAKAQMNVAFEEYIDLASIEDEQRAVKLSHHPDRLVQFSDPGVRSGKDGQGRPTGMAVQSWHWTIRLPGLASNSSCEGSEGSRRQTIPAMTMSPYPPPERRRSATQGLASARAVQTARIPRVGSLVGIFGDARSRPWIHPGGFNWQSPPERAG